MSTVEDEPEEPDTGLTDEEWRYFHAMVQSGTVVRDLAPDVLPIPRVDCPACARHNPAYRSQCYWCGHTLRKVP